MVVNTHRGAASLHVKCSTNQAIEMLFDAVYPGCISTRLSKVRSPLLIRTKLFLSNKTQAVRLPKAVSLPEGVEEVEIVAVGRSRIITPVGCSWDAWFAGEGVSDDFMSDRDQPDHQQRESFD